MSRYWSKLVGELSPYVPGQQPRAADLVKLNTNECPFGPSPRVLEALRAAADDGLRLYPDPQSTRLRGAVAAYHGVDPGQVFVGNGSDEVLAHAFAALLKQDRPLLFPDVTYPFYPVYCGLFGIAHEAVPLRPDMRVAVDDYPGRGGAVVLANPNALTGIALPLGEVERLLDACADVPVVVDEAYVDFGAETAVPLIGRHPNLLVVRTMSKSRALAGLRVGYAIGDPALVEALARVKDSFNPYPLGRLAQAGAVASIEDEGHFQATRSAVMRGRDAMVAALADLGFEVLPSAANFVFARHPGRSGAALAAALRARAVLVRRFDAPRVSDFLRISVGSEREIARLVCALGEALAEAPAAA